MKQVNTIEFTVGETFLPTLINSDLSGLTPDDVNVYNQWIKREQLRGYDFDCIDDEPFYDLCEVTEQFANCYLVTASRLIVMKD